MIKRAAQFALIAVGLIVLVMTTALVWLKAHEDELVFAAERGRHHLLTAFPRMPSAHWYVDGTAPISLLSPSAPTPAPTPDFGCCSCMATPTQPSHPGR